MYEHSNLCSSEALTNVDSLEQDQNSLKVQKNHNSLSFLTRILMKVSRTACLSLACKNSSSLILLDNLDKTFNLIA